MEGLWIISKGHGVPFWSNENILKLMPQDTKTSSTITYQSYSNSCVGTRN